MNREKNSRFLNMTVFATLGIILIFISAAALLWFGNANTSQAMPATAAQIYFDGEYRISDGQWQKIVKGEHISATKGDVTLRGNFHILTPDGEYIGIYSGSAPIAFYTDHINLTFYEGGESYVIDHENPLYGDSACGVDVTAHSFTGKSEEPIEILIHNPHSFGNETAVDEMLSNLAFQTGIEYEKQMLDSGKTERNMGIFFIAVSVMFLGTALFSILIHIKNSRILWITGAVILFAGTYIVYNADGVSFYSESIFSNTVILGFSMMFYMLFLLMSAVYFLKKTKTVGKIAVAFMGVTDTVLFMLPIVTDVLFYDTWLYWVILQILANTVLLICLVKELCTSSGKEKLLYAGFILPLIAFFADAVMTKFGIQTGGVISECVFIIFFVSAIVALLRIIPRGINALTKAKELETEKLILNAQLTESRISTMMSQIRPHFIYNTLGSIEQLCTFDPAKAGELVHNFAKYLRGNFGELDNPKPIPMSQEMEHVHHYISIENVRFPDMTFSFEMNSGDFHIPALTIQPIVENAIKHGLMKLPKGGTIRVVSYETDTHYCVSVEDDGAGFDTSVLLDERKHVGIRNIRGRLKAMVNGTLEIESTVGVGTKVLISIPKEVL